MQNGFWDDPKKAESIMQAMRKDKYWIDLYNEVVSSLDDAEVLQEFYSAGESTEEEVKEAFELAKNQLDELEFKSTLSKEEDSLHAILEINAGAGGTESNDWAAMILRMYTMWAENNGFKVTTLDTRDGEVAGIKSVSLEIQGEFAYGQLKGENGVHRLVRISPFDSSGRRHTSFAAVFVYPVVDDTIEIEVNPSDLDWDTFRASGAGGQHINKVETAVRVRHKPSGLVVECQDSRSQHGNRETALKMLKSKLYELEIQKQNEARAEIEAGKMKIEWGSQIRNYVLHPYKLVKDTRSNHETSQAQKVLDGELNPFIKSYLLHGKK